MRRLVALTVFLSACASTGAAPTPEEILTDGFVTDSEYLAAIEATSDCVEATGADFSVEFDRYNTPRFHASGRGGLETIVDSCLATHLGAVEFVWADQNAPSPEEDAAFYDAVVSCVEEVLDVEIGTVEPRGSGRAPDTAVTDAAIAADPDLYAKCFDLHVAREGGGRLPNRP